MSLLDQYGQDGSILRYYSLARHALLDALRIIGIRTGDRVLFPRFICRDLLASVHMLGAVPLYYDVYEDLSPVDLPVSGGVRAVLTVHYFGFPQNLEPFREYCRLSGAVLIEDNAHGFMSRSADGSLLGTSGDFGICSMRKTLLMPNGGMLLINNPAYHQLVVPQVPFGTTSLSMDYRVKHLLSQGQRRTGLPLRAYGQNLIRLARKLWTGHAIAPVNPGDEFAVPMGAAPHESMIDSVSAMSNCEEVARRRGLYDTFSRELTSFGVNPVFSMLHSGVSPYGFPFYADTPTQVALVTKLARKRGLDCIHWPDLPREVTIDRSYYEKLWVVNFLC